MVPGDDCKDNLNWNLEGYLSVGISNHSATIVTLESGEQVIYAVGGIKILHYQTLFKLRK